jgi:hypothetical protein
VNRAECFPDTNIFLHYRPLDEIDWLALTGATEVVLSIAAKVVWELDDKKMNAASQGLRDRAHAAIKRLREWRRQGGEIRPGVTVRFIAGEPPVADWHVLDLDEKVPDDRIIAAAITQRLDGYDVFLATSDFGPELKCERHRISVVTPREDDLLPDLQAEQDKRVVQLQRRLAILERKEPKLRLELGSEGKRGPHIEIVFRGPLPFLLMSDAQIEQRIKEEEAQLLAQIPSDLDNTTFADARSGKVDLPAMMKRVPESEAKRFRDSIPGYLTAFRAYLRASEPHYIRSNFTAKLNCTLVNDGHAPAEGIKIKLHIPDGPNVFDEESLPEAPEKPEAPELPQTSIEIMEQGHRGLIQSVLPSLYTPFQMPDLSRKVGPSLAPHITKTNSYDLVHKWPELQHHHEITFEPFYCSFPTVDAVQSFGIDYKIHARNLAEPVKNTLHVIFRVEPPPSLVRPSTEGL